MNFADYSNELLDQIKDAKSREEIESHLKDAQVAYTSDDLDKFWLKVSGTPVDVSELSDDEMDAVAGGDDIDLNREPCAATVENGSWCWSNDACKMFEVTYKNWWAVCDKSPYGKHCWEKVISNFRRSEMRCKFCGQRESSTY